MPFTPLIRDNMDSNLLVTSISMTRAEFPFMPNVMFMDGICLEGLSFTGNKGANASPTNATQMNDTITVNDDITRFFFNLSCLLIIDNY